MAYFKKNYYLTYILILSFIAFLLLVWLGLGQHGLIDLYKMQQEKGRYLANINDLKEKSRILTAEIRRLREDPKYFESVARRELGLVKANEIIYRFGQGQKGNKITNGDKK